MLSFHRKSFGLESPSDRPETLRLRTTALFLSYLKRVGSMLLTGVILGASIVMIFLSLGVRLPMLQGSSNADPESVKPRLVENNPATQSCGGDASQENPYFSLCPTFSVDYSNQQQGSINTKQFNVTTGPGPSNHEAEYYTGNSDNLRIENGSLVFEARQQADQGYKYTSARIDTHGKEDFLYGKLVIRAKLPDGIGTWPAIWMLPSQPKYASMSPASDADRYLNDGEIDISESAGVQPHLIYGVAHSLAYPENINDHAYFHTVTVPDSNTTFHDYEVDWTPTALTFSVDGKPFFTYAKQPGATWESWPYDQPFYLVINLALGGTWAGDDKAQFPGDGIDKAALPAELQVQSIRYYSYQGAQ